MTACERGDDRRPGIRSVERHVPADMRRTPHAADRHAFATRLVICRAMAGNLPRLTYAQPLTKEPTACGRGTCPLTLATLFDTTTFCFYSPPITATLLLYIPAFGGSALFLLAFTSSYDWTTLPPL